MTKKFFKREMPAVVTVKLSMLVAAVVENANQLIPMTFPTNVLKEPVFAILATNHG